MKLFDSHCHLDDRAYDDDIREVVTRMNSAGVVAAMIVGTTRPRSIKAVSLAESFPGLYASVGIHPHDAKTAMKRRSTPLKTFQKIPVFTPGEKSDSILTECSHPKKPRKSG